MTLERGQRRWTVGPEKEHDCFLAALQSVIVHAWRIVPKKLLAGARALTKRWHERKPTTLLCLFFHWDEEHLFVIPVIHSRVQRESLSLAPERKPSRQWSEFKVVDRLVEVFASLLTKVSNESWPRVWRFGAVGGGRFQSEGDGWHGGFCWPSQRCFSRASACQDRLPLTAADCCRDG